MFAALAGGGGDPLARACARPLERYLTLQAGLDLLDQGLSIFDADLRLVAWNRAYVRLLGFTDDMAYMGAPFESFIGFNARRGEYGPGDPDQLVADRVAAARHFAPHEIERVRPDGRVLRSMASRCRAMVSSRSIRTSPSSAGPEEIIRRHNAELEGRVASRTAELQSSEERVRLIMDSIPALVAYFDHRRVYRYLNRGYHDWFCVDTSRPEAVSAKAFLGDAVYAMIKPQVLRALAGEAQSLEYELQTCDARRLWVRTSLVPQRSAEGAGRRLLRTDLRHHAGAPLAGAAGAGPEAGLAGSPDRRAGARLQQHPDGRDRQPGGAGGGPPGRSGAGRLRASGARRRAARGRPGARPAELRPPPAAAGGRGARGRAARHRGPAGAAFAARDPAARHRRRRRRARCGPGSMPRCSSRRC